MGTSKINKSVFESSFVKFIVILSRKNVEPATFFQFSFYNKPLFYKYIILYSTLGKGVKKGTLFMLSTLHYETCIIY